MKPLFDEAPKWRWTKAEGRQDYGYVNNELTLLPFAGMGWSWYVNVPTEIFPFLEVAGTARLRSRLRHQGATFILEEQEDGAWLFCIDSCGTPISRLVLWRSTRKAMPQWFLQKTR
jgi:hypothetical protein